MTGAFKKVEDGFVDRFLTHEGETVEDAKKRLAEEQAKRETESKEAEENARASVEASKNVGKH